MPVVSLLSFIFPPYLFYLYFSYLKKNKKLNFCDREVTTEIIGSDVVRRSMLHGARRIAGREMLSICHDLFNK